MAVLVLVGREVLPGHSLSGIVLIGVGGGVGRADYN